MADLVFLRRRKNVKNHVALAGRWHWARWTADRRPINLFNHASSNFFRLSSNSMHLMDVGRDSRILRVFLIVRLMFRQSEEWWARTPSATTDAAEFCNSQRRGHTRCTRGHHYICTHVQGSVQGHTQLTTDKSNSNKPFLQTYPALNHKNTFVSQDIMLLNVS
jgi:hypothetical protein